MVGGVGFGFQAMVVVGLGKSQSQPWFTGEGA